MALNTQHKTVYGFEAFSRPSTVFQQEKNSSQLLTIDITALYMATTKAEELFPNDTPIFVNITPGTVIFLYKHQRKLSLPGINLVLELTEQENNRDRNGLVEAVQWIRGQLNCKIAIDDIASGYNRLRYLCDLEPDYVKIDRPLVQGCHLNQRKQAIIKGLCNITKLMGGKVIAEGIETIEESETLASLGVYLGQGFLFGFPS